MPWRVEPLRLVADAVAQSCVRSCLRQARAKETRSDALNSSLCFLDHSLFWILLAGFLWPAAAQAGACLSYEAAYQIESLLAGGMSWKNALQAVIQDDYSDGSPECLKAIKKEVNQTPYAFPKIDKAVYKRTTR